MSQSDSSPEQQRALLEAICDVDSGHERIFELVAALANLFDRRVVVETLAALLDEKPVDDGDSVSFGDIAIRFDANDRLTSIYRTFDGSVATDVARMQ